MSGIPAYLGIAFSENIPNIARGRKTKWSHRALYSLPGGLKIHNLPNFVKILPAGTYLGLRDG